MSNQEIQAAEGASFKVPDSSQTYTYDHLLDPNYEMPSSVEVAAVRAPRKPGEYSDWLGKNRGIDRAVGTLQAEAGLPDTGRSATESAAYEARVAEISARATSK